jgi:hypothetical protein
MALLSASLMRAEAGPNRSARLTGVRSPAKLQAENYSRISLRVSRAWVRRSIGHLVEFFPEYRAGMDWVRWKEPVETSRPRRARQAPETGGDRGPTGAQPANRANHLAPGRRREWRAPRSTGLPSLWPHLSPTRVAYGGLAGLLPPHAPIADRRNHGRQGCAGHDVDDYVPENMLALVMVMRLAPEGMNDPHDQAEQPAVEPEALQATGFTGSGRLLVNLCQPLNRLKGM